MTSISFDIFTQINYWAVLTAAITAFFLGGLWYSPALFESYWMTSNGYSDEQVKTTMSMLVPFGFMVALLAYVMVAIMIAFLTQALGVTSVWGGILIGLIVWIGFVAPNGLTITLFSPRPLTGWFIDAGFQFIYLLISGAILGAWRS